MTDTLPSISIVVPNFNGSDTLGDTLQSLVDQNYPALEILVVDGGSVDGSLDVIRSFEPHLAWWVSEPDSGQTDAINKGLARAGGDVVNWLCSDDVLLPGALDAVGRAFQARPDIDVFAGAGEVVYTDDPGRNHVWTPTQEHFDLLPAYNGIHQQSCFWKRSLLQRRPPLIESYYYAMDMELWCYLKSRGAKWELSPVVLSRFVMGSENKTSGAGIRAAAELERIYRRYAGRQASLAFWYHHFRYPFERLLRRDRGPLRLGLLRVIQAIWMLALMPFYGYGRVRYMSWPE